MSLILTVFTLQKEKNLQRFTFKDPWQMMKKPASLKK